MSHQQELEFEETDPGRDIGVEKEKHGLYEDLKEKKSSPLYGVSLRDIFLFSVGYSRQNAGREKLSGERHWMFGRDRLTKEQEWIIKSVAVEEMETTEVLRDGKQVYQIAQEYANGGIKQLHTEAFSPEGDPFSELTSDVVKTHNSDES